MSDRQRRILATLVTEYIEQGEPVSSAWLAERSALGLSSATVRNVLARLEERGLVRQPHTSAGRVPTDSGYRLYVDELLGSRARPKPVPDMEARLRGSGTISDLLDHASRELSHASHQIGFALAPANPSVRLQHIDFVNLDGTKVLVIVVAAGGHVSHRVIETEERYDPAVLTQSANYINREFAGLTMDEARTAIVDRMQEERILYDALSNRALMLARSGLDQVRPEDPLHLQGTSFFIDGIATEAADRQRTIETLRTLFRMIEEKQHLIELLSRSIEADGLTVVIGSENASPDLHPFSFVISTYRDGDRTGTVGVIGPTRMRYRRAISAVDGVSRAVTRLLERE